jgi:hypothetical protein
LASVDSEGSWLSGKPVKRMSGPLSQPLKEKATEPGVSVPGALEPEDEGLADDEYLKRLSPPPGDRRESVMTNDRRASSTVIDLQGERDPSPAPAVPPLPATTDGLGEGVGRQAAPVGQANQAKAERKISKAPQGKERRGSEEENEEDDDDDHSGGEVEEPQLMRARSVEYKTHARHMSAGSAKLLDIRRQSVQSMEMPTRNLEVAPAQSREAGATAKPV